MIGHIWIRRYRRRRHGSIERVRAHWRGLPK